MRASFPRRALSTRPAGWMFAFPALATLAGVAACADSLHLDPPGAGSGGGSAHASGTTGSHGSSSSGGSGCHSNLECTYPIAVCDTVANQCVECLTFADCGGKPGTVCSHGVCGCHTESDAAPPMDYCPATVGNGGHCVDLTSSPSDCGTCGHACFGSCAMKKCADKWQPTATAGAPVGRARHVAVWTGSRMIVWGGQTAGGSGVTNTGGLYDPVKDTWQPTSVVSAPSPRADAAAVWDDVENVMLVWGGTGPGGVPLGTGGRYDPATNAWTPMTLSKAPPARYQHTAVWGKTLTFMGATHGMIVWGGASSATVQLADGYVYDPTADAWLAITGTNPTARSQHAAVWSSALDQMIVFGGYGTDPVSMLPNAYLNDAWTFDPSTGWVVSAATGAPSPRRQHTAVWAGTSMLVFGGFSAVKGYLGDGGKYDPLAGGTWTALGMGGPMPEGRIEHTAVWVDATKTMVVFGGDQGAGAYLDSGWALDLVSNTWKALPTAPEARSQHTAVVNGSTMIVWGGNSAAGLLATGASFDTAP